MIRIGIICPSEIALRRFLPALNLLSEFQFMGVAVADKTEWIGATNQVLEGEYEKAEAFVKQFGGKIYNSYESIIAADEIDAVYLPLPPALHFHWAKLALKAGKHVLIEKPATTLLYDTQELIALAKKSNLSIHENYMFAYHDQLSAINEIIQNGEIGDVRLYRISFGFPRRSANDFRYKKTLGGGALLDAGGYTLKYASMLLGDTAKIVYAKSNYIDEFDVEIAGSAALVNDDGITVQIAFGMDNDYKCDLDVWGSKGTLFSNRVLTAPEGFVPQVNIKKDNIIENRKLPADDAFKKSIMRFQHCLYDNSERLNNYVIIEKQAKLVNEFLNKANI